MSVATATTRFQAALGLEPWTLAVWRPRHLAGLVDRLWCFEGSSPVRREQHFPHGFAELAVHLGAPSHFVKGATRECCATTALSGLQTSTTVIALPLEPSRVLGVRLHPAGAYAILGSSLCEATGSLVDLKAVLGRAASELAERCDDAEGVDSRLRRAADWVSQRVRCAPGLDGRVAWTASRIEASHGTARIGELRKETGLSAKRFDRSFREQIGVAPKVYARVVRFRRALALLHEGRTSLAQAACAAGYYDQAHMNLEFRAMGGLTPAAFLAARRHSATTTVA